jgi:hypothetical protein
MNPSFTFTIGVGLLPDLINFLTSGLRSFVIVGKIKFDD